MIKSSQRKVHKVRNKTNLSISLSFTHKLIPHILVRRYVRKGIPPQLRGKAWLHYSGAEAKMAANPGVYDKFVNKAEQLGDENEFADIIKRDLHRTFPDNIQYRSSTTTATTTTTTTSSASHSQASSQPPIISALQRVLSAFSLYSPSIGYCQSLNYIVGMLLLFMPEEEAFWTLVTIIQNILPAGVYDVTMEGSSIDQTVLMMLLWERMPHIWSKVADKKSFWDSAADGASMPSITLVTNHWFLTLFINVLPVEVRKKTLLDANGQRDWIIKYTIIGYVDSFASLGLFLLVSFLLPAFQWYKFPVTHANYLL